MRDRLVELLGDYLYAEQIADHLLANGVIAPPCKVGDTVWDTEGNAWKIFAITIWQDCISLKTANNRNVRKTFTIGKRSIGKTVFLTKEEAEQALSKSVTDTNVGDKLKGGVE